MNSVNQVTDINFQKKHIWEIVWIAGVGLAIYFLAVQYDVLERIVLYSSKHENWELDEFITLSVYLTFALAFFAVRRWRELRKSRVLLSEQNEHLQKALTEISHLQGIIPICSNCKQIRDDKGYWSQVETYIQNHTEAEFSHGGCPDCIPILYPELMHDKDNKPKSTAR